MVLIWKHHLWGFEKLHVWGFNLDPDPVIFQGASVVSYRV